MLCPPTHIVTSWTFCPLQSGKPSNPMPVLNHGGPFVVAEGIWAEITLSHAHCTWHSRSLLTSVIDIRRDEVAGCSERAYRSLTVEDAQRVLLMPNSQETCHYAAEVRAH